MIAQATWAKRVSCLFGRKEGFLFLENQSLYQGTETVLEVKTGDDEAVSAFYLNPEENLYLNFTENYLKTMLSDPKDKNFLSFKLVNFSDKSTILNELVDQNLNISLNGKELGSLKSMDLATLKETNRKTINNYYSHLIDKITNNYDRLYDENPAIFLNAGFSFL